MSAVCSAGFPRLRTRAQGIELATFVHTLLAKTQLHGPQPHRRGLWEIQRSRERYPSHLGHLQDVSISSARLALLSLSVAPTRTAHGSCEAAPSWPFVSSSSFLPGARTFLLLLSLTEEVPYCWACMCPFCPSS